MLRLEDIIRIRKAVEHENGYEIVFPNNKIIWITKKRTIAGLLLLIKYQDCSEADLVGTNGRLQEVKRILRGKMPDDLIQDRYGDANKPFSELWTEEGFTSVHAAGMKGNRIYQLAVADHETLFNPNAKATRVNISAADKAIVLKKQNYLCCICGAKLREPSEVENHVFAKDRVKMEIDHRIPVDRGGASDISNYQALCHYCNKCKRQMCFVCKKTCNADCALVSPETKDVVLATNENIKDRIVRH